MFVNMAKKVRDTITGFSGVVVGHVEYISGCNQSLVQPPVKTDGEYVEGRYIDDDRLSVIEETPVSHMVHTAGFDKPAPVR